jgi:endoglucanase
MLEKNNVGLALLAIQKNGRRKQFHDLYKPDGYDAIVNYTEKNRESFEQIRKAALADRVAIKKALYDMIEHSKFANARPNKAYSDALGLKYSHE